MKRTATFSVVLVIALLFASFAVALGESETDVSPADLYLYTGSPLILHNNQIDPLDPNNLEVAATVVGGRTLLPLRAISEYFGAVVQYDAVAKQAVIDYQDSRYFFPVGKKQYTVFRHDKQSGDQWTKVAMDTQSLIMNDRIMVPVRVISEEILGLSVSYYNHAIAIGEKSINLKSNADLMNQIKTKIGSAVKPLTIAELRHSFAANNTSGPVRDLAKDGSSPSNVVTAAPAEESGVTSSDSAGAGTNGYSQTNTQVEGMDEADVVKTDGTYVYLAAGNAIRIVETDQGSLKDLAKLKLDVNKNVQELYIDATNHRLVVLGTRFESLPYPGGGVYPMLDVAPVLKTEIAASDDKMSILPYPYYGKNYAFTEIYDVTNPEHPTLLKGHEMEGSYQTSRMHDGIVYMVTNTYLYNGDILPLVRDTATGSEGKPLALKDVMILPDCTSSGYVVVSAIDLSTEEKAKVEAIASPSFQTYMNDHALYLASSDYGDGTTIHKFAVDGLNIGYAGSGTVKGYLLNQFSMDEYEGYLRVATTTWDAGSALYVLDDSLNVSGSVTGLAKGETIYSARFFGDKGYIVTYRTMDPLFVFDLKDPANPKLTGELEIPGFSNYLHPIGKDLLLGVGAETFEIYQKDANGNEVVIGTRQGGIKVSLFDVSDLGKPKEISKYVAGFSGSYSEAFYNHKAIFFDTENQTLAFDADITTDVKGSNYQSGALLFGYQNNQVTLKGTLKADSTGYYGVDTPYARRILTIGDYLYYVRDGQIRSYSYPSLNPVDTLSLQ